MHVRHKHARYICGGAYSQTLPTFQDYDISGDISYPNLPFTIRDQPYQLRHLNTTQLSVPFAISNLKSDGISLVNQLYCRSIKCNLYVLL